MTGLDDSQYAVSSSRRYLAWMDEETMSDKIHIMDLETGNSFDITAGSGELLKPMAFMDDDLIYGTLNESDITADGAGSTVYPMYKLTIADISQGSARELMSYQKSGVYITDVSIESYTIYLDRIRIDSEGIITAAEGDTIKNSAGEQNKAVDVAVASDDVKQQVLTLTMTPLEEDESLGSSFYFC
jgi:hypothetical protein